MNIGYHLFMHFFHLCRYSICWKWILFSCILGCISAPYTLKGQQKDIKFKTLTSKDGMSSSTAWSLAQDQHGLIWVGTHDGLNVYNGYEFKTYLHAEEDTNSISHNFISSLLFDRKNRLWVGTPQGLDLYDSKKDHFINFTPANYPGNHHPNIYWVYEDQEHTLFAGTKDGLNFFNEATQQLELHPLPDEIGISTRITAMLHDQAGLYWIGTEDGLYLYDPKKKNYKLYRQDENKPAAISHNYVNTLFEDSKGNIWVGSKGGLDMYQDKKDEFRHYRHQAHEPNSLSFNYVYCIDEDKEGNLWIGTSEGGLNKFNPSLQTFERFVRDAKDPYSLADNLVNSIMVDKRGALWATTFRGLCFKSQYQFQFHHLQYKAYDPASLTDNFITALFKDSKGNIWTGNRKGISQFNANENKFSHYTHRESDYTSIADGAILNLTEDAEGNLWGITHTNSLNKLNRKEKTFDRYNADPEDSSSIQEGSNFVYATQDGNVWVSFKEGISLYDKKKEAFRHFFIPDSIRMEEPSFLYEDAQNNFLVVSGGAIYEFDKEKGSFSLSQLIPKEYRPFQTTHIYEDKNNNFWIGSAYQGLIRHNLKRNSFKLYKNKEDLPDIFIKGILEDKQGHLWLSSNNGLCRFNPLSGKYRIFSLADGLPHSEFNLRACTQSVDGKLYFGGNNGISVFHPEQVLQNPHPPTVILTNFQLFNQTVPIGEDSPLKKSIRETKYIELDYKQSVLSFEFVALNYNSSEKNQYAYRMLGFEDDWNYSGTRRHVTYTNLPPGKTYTFQVKASNNDGVWNETGTALQLYIKPPFWTTWWFYILLGCVALSILYGLYRWRTRQLYLQRRKLEEMVKLRTGEVEAQKEALSAHASHLKMANKKIKIKNKKILLQAKKLKAIDQLKSQFLANISHELRTPLTLILVPLEEMILRSQTNSDTKGQLSMMDRNARRLLQLINQLLDLSKLENGGIPLELKEQNIISFFSSVSQPFRAMAQKYQINYQVSCPEKELMVSFDADKLEKIVFNLVSNAFKFTPAGGNVHVSITEIALTGMDLEKKGVHQERYVQMTISDTGQGIAAKHLPNIFDRFYQAEPSLVRKSEGTGIGLALTKELVELHGGKINVKSEPGQGTCFTVLIPSTSSTANQPAPPETKKQALLAEVPDEMQTLGAKELKGERKSMATIDKKPEVIPDKKDAPLLLIVEDNTDLRQQIRRIFSSQFRVEEAADGHEGWTMASEKMPDFIISDVMMPGKDGLALCHQLKNDPATSHIPTILLSARIDGEEEGLSIGADDYITKPFNAKSLVLKVGNLLDTRQKFKEAICRELGVQPFSQVSGAQTGISQQDKKFIEQAVELALKHLSSIDFELETFYRELGMSRTLAYKKLKSLTGLGPNEFIRQIRLNKASSLLLQEKYSVSEVMDEVGFNHRSYFIKCFKNEFGHLPSEHSTQKQATAIQRQVPIEGIIQENQELAKQFIKEKSLKTN